MKGLAPSPQGRGMGSADLVFLVRNEFRAVFHLMEETRLAIAAFEISHDVLTLREEGAVFVIVVGIAA